MNGELRPTGIEAIGDVSWGTHFCHFYETDEDLLSILVPFFKAGLESNEYCIWVTSAHVTVEQAHTALKKAVPKLDQYLQHGSIEILTPENWYLKKGRFNSDGAIPSILTRLHSALQQDFEGLRVNGAIDWIDREDWENFIEYERALNPAIKNKKLIIFCTYPLGKCVEATDILDIALKHESVVAKRKGQWEVLESLELKKSKALIQRENEMLELNIAERTQELEEVSNVLDKSQSRLRAIFDTTNIAFLLLDSELRVLTFNTVADDWSELSFGTRLKEGRIFIELLKEDRKGPVREMMNAAMAGASINYEASYPFQDESSEWYSINISPVKDSKNQIIGLCCSATNITSGKVAELKRIQISTDLVHRNKDLEQFAYIVSHNLRAPLANIIGLSRIIRQPDLSLDEKTESEEFLFKSIEKLDEVVRDLNQILQARRNINETKEKVIFAEVVNDVLTGFQLLIEQEHIKVITDFGEADGVYTIKSYLYSIFYNLISNSIKYRQPEIPLVVEIRSLTWDNKIGVIFKDNARGIDLSVYGEDVFGLYKRFNTDTEGKGLGLYMVKNHAEALGGHISVSSQVGVGTIFSVELPV